MQARMRNGLRAWCPEVVGELCLGLGLGLGRLGGEDGWWVF